MLDKLGNALFYIVGTLVGFVLAVFIILIVIAAGIYGSVVLLIFLIIAIPFLLYEMIFRSRA